MPSRFFRQTLWNATALASGGSLESSVIDLTHCEIEYLELALSTGVSPGVKIRVRFSTDGVTFNSYDDQDNISDSTLVENPTTPNGAHHYLIPRHKFIQIKLEEIATVVTTVTGRLECSEI